METQIAWVLIAWQVIHFAVRYLKSDSPLPEWLHVSPGWRPVVVIALGQVSGVLEMVIAGTPWLEAMAGGLISAAGAWGQHQGIVVRMRNGKELPVPFVRKEA